MTKDADKGTDELEYMKEAVVTICRKDLDKFEDQSKGSTRWFNIDSELKKSTIDPEFYLKKLKGILKVKTRNCIKRFLYRLINNPSRKKRNKCTKLDHSIRSTSTIINSGGQNSNWYIC